MNTTVRGRELLNKDQRASFMKFPDSDKTIGSYYTFSKEDIEIIKAHRKEENQLGFAIQLAIIRYPGWSYTSFKHIPDEIIKLHCKTNFSVSEGSKILC